MSAGLLPFDAQTRQLFGKLAEALFPFRDWIATKLYIPPNADKLPWRKKSDGLKASDLGVIDFFERLLRETVVDTDLLDRWNRVRAQPLGFCPLERPEEWRRARGLDPVPVYDIVGGDNTLTDTQGVQISRMQFYESYLPLLLSAVAARTKASQSDPDKQIADDAGWRKFALELAQDSCVEWPGNQPDASRVIAQFTRDLLYAVLGMRNSLPEPWRSAVLTEIGELRRPGNVFTRSDVEAGLADFKEVLATYQAQEVAEPGTAAAAEALSLSKLDLAAEEQSPQGAKAYHLSFHPPAGGPRVVEGT